MLRLRVSLGRSAYFFYKKFLYEFCSGDGMKRFLKSIFLLVCCGVIFAELYVDGYLDYTPLYDVIYGIVNINGEKIDSPILEGDMLSFCDKEGVGVVCDGNSVIVSARSDDIQKRHLIIRIEEDGAELSRHGMLCGDDDVRSLLINIPPEAKSRIEVSVYANSQPYGSFKSWVNHYTYFVRTENGWQAEQSPVLEHNEQIYSKQKVLASALEDTKHVQSENPSIKAIAQRETANCTTDYEKALALHDYVCKNLYYDSDMAKKKEIPVESAADVIVSGKGVCSGFANVYAALCRSVNLPCVVVTGYAVGSELFEQEWNEENIATKIPNHAWNEVYADGRWVIVDTTWDNDNYCLNGTAEESINISRLYFDANLKAFSANHKILRYKDI